MKKDPVMGNAECGSEERTDCLACFSLRLPGKGVDYEIRHYHDPEREKYLRVVQYRKGKFFHERSVDLSLVDPEFLELRPQTPRRLPMVLAWSWVVLTSAMLLAVGLLAKNGDLLSLIPGGLWALATDLYCFDYIFYFFHFFFCSFETIFCRFISVTDK